MSGSAFQNPVAQLSRCSTNYYKVVNSRSLGCEGLETVKVWSLGFAQGYNLAIDNSLGGKIAKRVHDLRESFVEVLVAPRAQSCAASLEFQL